MQNNVCVQAELYYIGLTAKVTSSRTTVPNAIHFIQSDTLVPGN